MGRRRYRHPEAVAAERAARAMRSVAPPNAWQHDAGWLVILYAPDKRSFRNLPPGTTYIEAKRFMREELRLYPEFYKAWLHHLS